VTASHHQRCLRILKKRQIRQEEEEAHSSEDPHDSCQSCVMLCCDQLIHQTIGSDRRSEYRLGNDRWGWSVREFGRVWLWSGFGLGSESGLGSGWSRWIWRLAVLIIDARRQYILLVKYFSYVRYANPRSVLPISQLNSNLLKLAARKLNIQYIIIINYLVFKNNIQYFHWN